MPENVINIAESNLTFELNCDCGKTASVTKKRITLHRVALMFMPTLQANILVRETAVKEEAVFEGNSQPVDLIDSIECDVN